MIRVKAFCPAAISSFFASYLHENPLKCGAWGGGFTLEKGVEVTVSLDRSQSELEVSNFINGKPVDSPIIKTVLKYLSEYGKLKGKLKIKQRIEVPIGCGYGTSGASALAAAMALSKIFKIKITYMQMARIAHLADFQCKTGLGTVAGIVGPSGGIKILTSPGAPGYAVVDKIFIPKDFLIVSASFGPIRKEEILKDHSRLEILNQIGMETLRRILRDPTPKNFMKNCRRFALKAGFMSGRVKILLEQLDETHIIGATQNMIGEAVHSLVEEKYLDEILKVYLKFFHQDEIIVSKVDELGPRYL